MAYRPAPTAFDKANSIALSDIEDEEGLDESATHPSRSSGSYLDYDDMVVLAKNDIYKAVAACRAQIATAEEGVREEEYGECAVIIEFAHFIDESDAEWDRCTKQEIWDNQIPDRRRPLLAAFKFVRRSLRGPKYEQSRFRAKALSEFYRLNLPVEGLKQYILDNGGLKSLHKAEIDRQRQAYVEAEVSRGGTPELPRESKQGADKGTSKRTARNPARNQSKASTSAKGMSASKEAVKSLSKYL